MPKKQLVFLKPRVVTCRVPMPFAFSARLFGKYAARLLILVSLPACSSPGVSTPRKATVSLTIGAVDDPQYSLSRVEGIATSPQGHVYILQHEDANVREFDSAGVFVRIIGRRGMGPGEFSLPTKLWWSDGGLSVLDGNLLRVTDIDQNGLLRSTRPLSAVGVSLELQNPEELKDHSQLAQERVVHGHPILGRDSTPLVHISDRRADTIAWLDVRNVAVTLGANRHFIQARHPFADNDVVRIGPTRDTFIVARRTVEGKKARVQLSWFDLSGHRIRERTIDLRAVPIPPFVRDSVIDHFAHALTQSAISSTTDAARSLVRRTLQIPEYYPAFTDLLVGTDGSIWLGRGSSQTSETWLHVSPSGLVLSGVAVPSGIRLLNIRPPYAWGTQTNDAGVPHVVRLLIE